MDYKFKTEPYEHQLTALGASHNKENFALFMEMGTGKSKVNKIKSLEQLNHLTH